MISKSQRTVFHSLILASSLFWLTGCSTQSNWRTAKRDSAGIAPAANEVDGAIFQIYTARAFSWRGYFGVHPWVAWKRKEDKEYTVAQVTAWGLHRGNSSVSVQNDIPDRYWFGSKPSLLVTVTGERAEKIIDNVQKLIENYPYSQKYTIWPGPNSNTFVDHLIRFTPELTVELPASAIGKDFLTQAMVFDKSPSGKGFQFSLYGLFGLTVGLAEGIEVNVLSLTFGIDILRPALKLPFIGRLGLPDEEL